MSKHEPIKVKGHNFLRECHFPMYWLARMREMRIGDTFIMGSVRHHYGDDGLDYRGIAEVHCTKGKLGVYSLYSTWSLLTNNPLRPLMFSKMRFKIEPGGYLSFFENFNTDLKTFKRTSRLLNCLINIGDDKAYSSLGLPRYFYGVCLDKDKRTTRHYWQEGKGKLTHYIFGDEQMPKPMMECICDYGIASGLINFDKSRSAI